MPPLAQLVRASLNHSLFFLRHSVSGFAGDEWYARPHGAPSPPVWTLGHVAVSRGSMMETLGLKNPVPPDWAKTFGTGADPSSDPAAYPAPDRILACIEDAHRQLGEYLESASDEELLRLPPNHQGEPESRASFVLFLAGHEAHHSGGLVLMRRLMGKEKLV